MKQELNLNTAHVLRVLRSRSYHPYPLLARHVDRWGRVSLIRQSHLGSYLENPHTRNTSSRVCSFWTYCERSLLSLLPPNYYSLPIVLGEYYQLLACWSCRSLRLWRTWRTNSYANAIWKNQCCFDRVVIFKSSAPCHHRHRLFLIR